jgi:hypothetical protein
MIVWMVWATAAHAVPLGQRWEYVTNGITSLLEDRAMRLVEMFQQMMQYLSEGAANIFSPNRDNYPATGVQPYADDPPSETIHGSR